MNRIHSGRVTHPPRRVGSFRAGLETHHGERLELWKTLIILQIPAASSRI